MLVIDIAQIVLDGDRRLFIKELDGEVAECGVKTDH
jgi:hypothetical protein